MTGIGFRLCVVTLAMTLTATGEWSIAAQEYGSEAVALRRVRALHSAGLVETKIEAAGSDGGSTSAIKPLLPTNTRAPNSRLFGRGSAGIKPPSEDGGWLAGSATRYEGLLDSRRLALEPSESVRGETTDSESSSLDTEEARLALGPPDGVWRLSGSWELEGDSPVHLDKDGNPELQGAIPFEGAITRVPGGRGGRGRDCSGTYCEYLWYDVGQGIPDQGGAYAGVNTGALCEFPGDAYVVGVEVHVRIDDLNGTPGCPDDTFYCGDYKVWVSKGGPAADVHFYGRCGGRCDSGCDCDDEDDSDIYLSFTCSACLDDFDGADPADWWFIYVEDQLAADTGQIDQVGFRIYYEIGQPDPADLIVESSSRSPSTDVQPGDMINLVDTIRNQGAGPAESIFRVQWHISLDSTVNEDDAAWAYHDIACCLGPGETDGIDGYAPWPDAPPYNTPYTTYWIRVKADSWNEVQESNESNNWGTTWSVTLGAPPEQYPDLIIQDSSRTPATDVLPGDNIDLWNEVRNQGDADTTWSFATTWYISTDSQLDTSADFPWAAATIGCCLAPGETAEASGSVPWPGFSPYNTPGQTYYIAVMADDTELVTESNEDNNWGQVWTVTLDDEPPPQYPDLIIQSSSCTPLTGVEPAEPVDLGNVVKNQGDGATTWHFYATWYISTDSNITTGDYEWAYSYIPCCLAPGETIDAGGTVLWPDVPPYNTPGQTYYLAVMADDTELVSESNEYNNWGQTWQVTLGAATGDLVGTVRDGSTGDYIYHAAVSLDGGPPEYTTGQGQFSFLDVSAGGHTLAVTKSGYYDVTEPVTIEAGSTTEVMIWMTPESTGSDPVVVGVNGSYGGPGVRVYYLDDVWLNETFTATVQWNDRPEGSVQFITPYGTYLGSGGGNTWQQSFNMGADFGPGGTLTVVAVAGDSAESEPYVANLKVISPPPGMLAVLLCAQPAGDVLKYVTPNLSDIATGFAEGVDDVPDDMPLFGNEAFEFVSMFDASAEIDARSGSANVLSFDPDLPGSEGKTKLAGFEFTPSLSGQLTWQFYENPDHWVPGGHLQIGAQVGADVPPAPIVFFFGPVPCYFRGHIDVAVAVGLDVIGWDAPGQAVFSGTVNLDPFPYAEAMLGAGVADVVAVEGYLGGGARMLLVFPAVPPDNALESLQLYLAGGVRVVVWIFTYEWPLLEYTWEPGRSLCAVPGGPPVLHVMPRDYLRRPEGYAVFVANEAWHRNLRSVITAESEIEINVFGQSTPDLAAVGDSLLAAWIWDDPSRTATNRTELVFIHGEYDPGLEWWVWSTPVAVADDGTADYRPQVVTLPGGDALLAWEDVSEVLIEPGEPGDPCIDQCQGEPDPEQCQVECKLEETKSKTEIAVARYDGTAGTWGPQTILTNNDYLDRSPRVAAGPHGSAMLFWVSNTANEEIGSPANPNTVHYATYDGATWSAPDLVASDVPSVVRSAAAYDGTNAVLVYAGDTDDDPNTLDDRELFAAAFEGGAWGAANQLTTDAVEDANPQVVYDSSGGLLLVWYRAGDLVMKTDLSQMPPETVVNLEVEASSGMADFRLASGQEGQIALVWQDASQQRVDMWRAIYDPTLQIWSSPQQLTADDWMEHGITPVYTASGDLVAMYDKVDTELETRWVDINGEAIDVLVPVPDRTDLYLLRHKVTGDLAVRSEDLTVDPPDAAVGQTVTITAIVRNLGDVAAEDVEVGFYDGNPGEGGTLIDMPVIAGLLLGGEQASASVQWLVPPSPELHDIYVVADPYQVQEDGNRANNTAVLHGGLKPDLFIESFTVQEAGPDARVFAVRVGNGSGWPVSDFGVALRREAVDGELLTSMTVDEPIAPGAYQDLSWAWDDLPRCVVTSDVYAIVDEAGEIDEVDEMNNVRMTVAQLGPPFLLYDINYDGFVSIVGDVPPFVECLYFGNCPEDPDPLCPGDCSGDGFLSIVGDVPCFVDCLYFSNCGQRTGSGRDPAAGLTIGGVVYRDLENPLLSGVAGVTITVTPLDGTFTAARTTTAGPCGLWSVESVPAGVYRITPSLPGHRFDRVERGVIVGPAPATLKVAWGSSPAACQNLQFLLRRPEADDSTVRPVSSRTEP